MAGCGQVSAGLCPFSLDNFVYFNIRSVKASSSNKDLVIRVVLCNSSNWVQISLATALLIGVLFFKGLLAAICFPPIQVNKVKYSGQFILYQEFVTTNYFMLPVVTGNI